MKRIANPLKAGDVIQTHPQRGFWGCAVVLSSRDSTDQFHPMCHIGITSLITKRRYSWKSIDPRELRIVESSPAIRAAADEYYQSQDSRSCIGIYTLKTLAGITIIGSIDPALVYGKPLTFDVGDGTSGRFPLCGPIKEDIGSEAVIAWRKIHDRERLEKDIAFSRESFERYEQKRLSEQRAKRQTGGI